MTIKEIRKLTEKVGKGESLTTDEITELFFDMLAEDIAIKEIQKATGLLKVEEDESQTVLTLYYPNGDIISHWV